MATIPTAGDESIRVAAHGSAELHLIVDDPQFGRIASVRIDHHQAALLASALDRHLVDAAGGVPAGPEG